MPKEVINQHEKNLIIKRLDGLIHAGNYEDALEINIRTYEEALANDEYRLISYSLYYFGLMEEMKAEPQKAMAFYKKATSIARKHKVYDCLVQILNNRGNLYVLSGKLHSAIDKYLEALSIFESPDKPVHDAIFGKERTLNNLGVLYLQTGDYKKAKKFLFECVSIAKEKQQDLLLTTAYSNIGEIYILQNNYLKAKYYNKLSYEISNHIDDQIGIGLSYSYDAIIVNHDEQNWGKVSELFEKSLELLVGTDLEHDRFDVLLKYGREAHKAGMNDKSIELLVSLSEAAREKAFYQVELNALEILNEIYEESEDFEKAYRVSKRRLEISNTSYMQWKKISLEKLEKEVSDTIEMGQVEELHRSIKTLKTLSDIGRRITACTTKEEIFHVLFDSAKKIFKYDAFGVGVMKPNESKIEFMYSSNNVKGSRIIDIKDDDFLLVQCMLRGEEIIVFDTKDDVMNDKAFQGRLLDIIKGADNRSIIFAPLNIKDYTMGGITIQSAKKGQFTYVDLESLRVLTSYVSIAFSNIFRAEQLVVANEKLEVASMRDGLTGALNRHALGQYIGKEFLALLHQKLPASAFMIDIDFFKQYNDNYGHVMGDKCLKSVCNALRIAFQGFSYRLFRYGGDEFFVVVEGAGFKKAQLMINCIIEQVELMNIEHNYSKIADHVTLTIGATVIETNDIDYTEIFTSADEALYEAKDNGRNQGKIKRV